MLLMLADAWVRPPHQPNRHPCHVDSTATAHITSTAATAADQPDIVELNSVIDAARCNITLLSFQYGMWMQLDLEWMHRASPPLMLSTVFLQGCHPYG